MKINNNRRVAILMATYNGELYLKEQIESIFNQSYKDWTLYIQDDGSNDNTVNIINEYKSDKIVFVDLGLTRQGACLNFMSLLNVVDSQYYMFSDQDDFWLPNKIELSINLMHEEESKANPDTPIIIHTDRSFTDASLNIFRKSEFNPRNVDPRRLEQKLHKMRDLNILAIYTIVGGCTMLFNNVVKKIAFPFINVRMHDSTLAMRVANHGGVIATVYESTILYRQHSSNTCGVQEDAILPKLMRISNSIKGNMQGYYIWRVYGKGSFWKFLYYRLRYFLILRDII